MVLCILWVTICLHTRLAVLLEKAMYQFSFKYSRQDYAYVRAGEVINR